MGRSKGGDDEDEEEEEEDDSDYLEDGEEGEEISVADVIVSYCSIVCCLSVVVHCSLGLGGFHMM